MVTILGIDTSCYTTSVALCDESGRLLSDKRRLLPVQAGSCGLRQSEALFLHVQQLSPLLQAAFAETTGQPAAVAVSARPRPIADSYLPVFRAGLCVAESIASALRIPCYFTSHQEGHLAAALYSLSANWQQPFLALHLSGGTGELLHVVPQPAGYQVEIIGDTDLPPGQLIDRVGVALGLPFPAGPHLEKLAEEAAGTSFRLSGSVKDLHISFSGPEAAAQRAIREGKTPGPEIALAVFDNIAKSLEKVIRTARRQTGCQKVLLVGGVAANQRIRAKLAPLHVHIADPRYAGDNAVGVALLGGRMFAQA